MKLIESIKISLNDADVVQYFIDHGIIKEVGQCKKCEAVIK